MKNVVIFVPVAPFEPLAIIKKSIESLRQLENSDLNVSIIYVLDCPQGADRRARYLEHEHIGHIVRLHKRGRRAGAINDGLDTIRRPDGTIDADYIALFDVDSRPDPDFLVKCINMLQRDPAAVIASGVRYITNNSSGWVPGIIAAEYTFFQDIYQLFERYDGFKQFNGLIGVMDARAFDSIRLNEQVHCEDLEFTQQVYISGKKAILADTRVGEQAPASLKELYNQRVRWLSGSLEGIRVHMTRFTRAPLPINLKAAWLISMTLPFAAFLLTPIIPAYGIRLGMKGPNRVFYRTLGLVFHVWFITICGKTALLNRLRGKKIIWTDSFRSDI